MSRVRLYVDEDAAQSIVVDGLVLAGYDVLTAIQAGNRRASDEVQLQLAVADERAIYSLNASDFSTPRRNVGVQSKSLLDYRVYESAVWPRREATAHP